MNQLTNKELNYLKDHLSWELLMAKKCHDCAMLCADPDIKSTLNQVGQKHQQHYQTLLKNLTNQQTIQ